MAENYFADITNILHEAGILKAKEKIIDILEHCLLLERVTDKGYIYRLADPSTLKTKYLFTRKTSLPQDRYNKVMEIISEWKHSDLPLPLLAMSAEERATALLIETFINIFPQHEMTYREQQLDLSTTMLEALLKKMIALCEAEVGTGKTHAYILAIAIHNLFIEDRKSTIISTSTIALQKALIGEYLPQISQILIDHRITDKPFEFIVRKGKSHYICDKNLNAYTKSIFSNEKDFTLIHSLNKIRLDSTIIDLDDISLSNYVKKRICVTHCSKDCGYYHICRYQLFLNRCVHNFYDFQITNHNFLIADLLTKKRGGRPLLSEFGQIVIDEAHKLPATMRDMYGIQIAETEITILIHNTYYKAGKRKAIIKDTCLDVLKHNKLLFQDFANHQDKSDTAKVNVSISTNVAYSALVFVLKQLSMILLDIELHFAINFKQYRHEIEDIVRRLDILKNPNEWVLWLESSKKETHILSALSKKYGELLDKDLWQTPIPIILTSGTMSTSGDFSYLKNTAGLTQQKERILEINTLTPFDFQSQALLYLPHSMPFPSYKDTRYMQAVLEQLEGLINLTHGHTLVLFTSYNVMEKAFIEISKRVTDFPLFMMSKGKTSELSDFRNSGNGVLFASDSAGEGIDLAGDILSSLIVVRLPFPIPNALSEYEISLQDSFENYLADSIIPTMLIKLRQWIGRGIRRETDTCVFSILDSRASDRYFKEITNALPSMPITRDIVDVGRFIMNVKEHDYFE